MKSFQNRFWLVSTIFFYCFHDCRDIIWRKRFRFHLFLHQTETFVEIIRRLVRPGLWTIYKKPLLKAGYCRLFLTPIFAELNYIDKNINTSFFFRETCKIMQKVYFTLGARKQFLWILSHFLPFFFQEKW